MYEELKLQAAKAAEEIIAAAKLEEGDVLVVGCSSSEVCGQKIGSDSNEDVANLLDASGQLELRHEANIFVGGSILDRGLTIENLIGFVYGRSPQRMQMDTVLQHARMYGARKMADMAVTRFHTTNQLYDRLRRINAMDESLREQFEQAMKDGRDPDTVFVCRGANGQIVPCAPNRLLIASISTIAPRSLHYPVGFQTDG